MWNKLIENLMKQILTYILQVKFRVYIYKYLENMLITKRNSNFENK